MARWRTEPANRYERQPSGRVMPPKRWSPRGSRKPVGPSWPGTSMSVATSSISWRSTRARRPRSWSSRSAGGLAATSACRRRQSITANASAFGRRRTGCWTGARSRMAHPFRGCPCGSIWWSWSLGIGCGTIGTPCEGTAAAAADGRGGRLRPRPVLHSRPVRVRPSRHMTTPTPRGVEHTRGPFRPGRCRTRPETADRPLATRSAEV